MADRTSSRRGFPLAKARTCSRKMQGHMPATLSHLTPRRDGRSLAMSIGPCPPAAGHDGPVVHWVLPRPTDPAPSTGSVVKLIPCAQRSDGSLRSPWPLGGYPCLQIRLHIAGPTDRYGPLRSGCLPRPPEPAPQIGATGHDGSHVRWMLPHPPEPAPYVGATGHHASHAPHDGI